MLYLSIIFLSANVQNDDIKALSNQIVDHTIAVYNTIQTQVGQIKFFIY